MGMFSEIATEMTIKSIVSRIEKRIKDGSLSHDQINAVSDIGRYALTLFEWSTPEWAKEYQELFNKQP